MTLLVVWMGMPMGLLGSCGGPGAGVTPALGVCVGGAVARASTLSQASHLTRPTRLSTASIYWLSGTPVIPVLRQDGHLPPRRGMQDMQTRLLHAHSCLQGSWKRSRKSPKQTLQYTSGTEGMPWLGWRAQDCAHAGLVVCPAAPITALLPILPSTASGISPGEVSGVFSTERVDGHADAYWVACPVGL